MNGQLPVVSVSGPTTSCGGNAVALTASGANTYVWSTGSTTASINVAPTTTVVYTVTGTTTAGCSATATYTVNGFPVCDTTIINNCGDEGHTLSDLGMWPNDGIGAHIDVKNIPGATQYWVRLYLGNTQVSQLIFPRTGANNSITRTFLRNFPNIHFNNVYKVTVSVNKGSGFGPETKADCEYTLTEPWSYFNSTYGCGVTFSDINHYGTVPPPNNLFIGALSYLYTLTTPQGQILTHQQDVIPGTPASATYHPSYLYYKDVPGVLYNQTYSITVQIQYTTQAGTTAWGPPSSPCVVNFGLAQAPPANCNITYTKIKTYTTVGSAPYGAFGALAYKYSFTDASNTLIHTRTNFVSNPSPNAPYSDGAQYVHFDQIPGLLYNHSYTFTTEVLCNTPTGQQWGPPSSCIISFGLPQATLRCNTSRNKNSTIAITSPGGSITNYKLNFYNTVTNALVATKTQTSNSFNLQSVPNLVAGTYYWTITLEYATNLSGGRAWGPESSTTCLVTITAPGQRNSDSSDEEEESITSENVIKAFPNPTTGIVTIESSDEVNSIQVKSITGALILEANSAKEVDLSNYPAGMYFFTVNTVNGTQIIKIIKE